MPPPARRSRPSHKPAARSGAPLSELARRGNNGAAAWFFTRLAADLSMKSPISQSSAPWRWRSGRCRGAPRAPAAGGGASARRSPGQEPQPQHPRPPLPGHERRPPFPGRGGRRLLRPALAGALARGGGVAVRTVRRPGAARQAAGRADDGAARRGGVAGAGRGARLASQATSSLSVKLAIAVALSLWSASAAVRALFDALNVIDEQEEQRSLVRLYGHRARDTLGGIVALSLVVVLIGASPAFSRAASRGRLALWLAALAGVLLRRGARHHRRCIGLARAIRRAASGA